MFAGGGGKLALFYLGEALELSCSFVFDNKDYLTYRYLTSVESL